jgi:hypothetical protein
VARRVRNQKLEEHDALFRAEADGIAAMTAALMGIDTGDAYPDACSRQISLSAQAPFDRFAKVGAKRALAYESGYVKPLAASQHVRQKTRLLRLIGEDCLVGFEGRQPQASGGAAAFASLREFIGVVVHPRRF